MTPCCDPTGYDRVFGPRLARQLARRYRRRGLDAPSRRVVEVVAAAGVEGASVLEIGGGVGEVQVELLRRGARRATDVELVRSYDDDARALAAEAGVSDRIDRRIGDVALDPAVAPVADVVVLNRVVCCYPDDVALLGAAADHAHRLLVLTHPPAHAVARAVVGMANAVQRLRGVGYRAYVHDPVRMRSVLREHGLEPVEEAPASLWRVLSAARPGLRRPA